MKLFDTAVFHPAGEVAVSTNVMHDVSDVLQGRDHPMVQRLGNGERDDGCKENAAGQNGKRHPDEMADQTVTRGQANFADRCAVMHDGLRNRYGEKPAADQCAQRVVVVLRVPGPVGKPLFMRVNNLGHGKLALFPRAASVSLAASESLNTSDASRLWLIVAPVNSRFFCAYCFNVTTEAKQSSSHINVIVMMTLIMLFRLNVLLNVGRGVEVKSLSMLLIPCKH